MTARRTTWLAWSLLACVLAMLVAGLALAVMNGFEHRNEAWGTAASWSLLIPLVGVAFALVGAPIAARQPRNAVGWICLVCGLGVALMALAPQYALYAIEIRPGALPAGETAAWLNSWNFLLLVAPLGIYLVLLFPNGRLPSARWRVVAWAGGVSTVLAGVSAATLPGPLYSLPSVENPYVLDGPWELIGGVAFLGLGSCILAAAVSMVRRLRRARGEERQQLKWFAFAASVLAIVFVPVMLMDDATVTGQPLLQELSQDVASLLFAGPAIATGIAILRHRLYDIDVVINRTLVYGGLTATLAATYLGSVLLLQLALSPFTEGSSLAVAVSTLAVAALFGPARGWIQAIVDRRFYRRKYDAARTLERFGARVRDEVDLDAVGGELCAVVEETMQPAHVSLWLRVT